MYSLWQHTTAAINNVRRMTDSILQAPYCVANIIQIFKFAKSWKCGKTNQNAAFFGIIVSLHFPSNQWSPMTGINPICEIY